MAPTWSFQCGVPPSGATGRPPGPAWCPKNPYVILSVALMWSFPCPLRGAPLVAYVVFPMPLGPAWCPQSLYVAPTWCPLTPYVVLSHGPGVRCGPYTWFFPWPLRGAALALRGVPKTLTGYFPMAPMLVSPWSFPWPLRRTPKTLTWYFPTAPVHGVP